MTEYDEIIDRSILAKVFLANMIWEKNLVRLDKQGINGSHPIYLKGLQAKIQSIMAIYY